MVRHCEWNEAAQEQQDTFFCSTAGFASGAKQPRAAACWVNVR